MNLLEKIKEKILIKVSQSLTKEKRLMVIIIEMLKKKDLHIKIINQSIYHLMLVRDKVL
jgi:hypothetical protein